MDRQMLEGLANELGCEAAALRAVAEVESAGNGFLPDGRPKILFEAHIFGARTGHRFDVSHPTLSSRRWRRDLYQGGIAEWRRLEAARELAGDTALEACSWGAFQLMGFNFRACGFASAAAMAQAMHTEDGQTMGFAHFLKANPSLLAALQSRDWRRFARLYNGPGQVATYAARIGDAYARLSGSAVPEGLPDVDRTMPVKGIGRSKSLAVGGFGVAAGAGAVADQLDSILSALTTTRAAVSSAVGMKETLQAVVGGAAMPWLLTTIAVAALAFVLWRYAAKIRAGDAIVR